MKIRRRVVVFDAGDIAEESRFWAGLLGGQVHPEEDWHSVVVDGEWAIGVQAAPNHVPPDWPVGPQQQQVHLDLHVDDLEKAHELTLALGGRQLQAPRRPADNPEGDEFFAVYTVRRGTRSASAFTDSRTGRRSSTFSRRRRTSARAAGRAAVTAHDRRPAHWACA